MKAILTVAAMVGLLVSGCGGNADPTNPGTLASVAGDGRSGEGSAELPIHELHVSEQGGPASVAEAFEQSEAIVLTTLSAVTDDMRIYPSGSEEEDPNRTWYEEIGLVFSTVESFKGSMPKAGVTIPWTAYEKSSGEPGGSRVSTIEINELQINDDDIGKQYLLFLATDAEGSLDLISISGGLVEVTPDGIISGASPAGTLRELQGQQLDSVVSAAR